MVQYRNSDNQKKIAPQKKGFTPQKMVTTKLVDVGRKLVVRVVGYIL